MLSVSFEFCAVVRLLTSLSGEQDCLDGDLLIKLLSRLSRSTTSLLHMVLFSFANAPTSFFLVHLGLLVLTAFSTECRFLMELIAEVGVVKDGGSGTLHFLDSKDLSLILLRLWPNYSEIIKQFLTESLDCFSSESMLDLRRTLIQCKSRFVVLEACFNNVLAAISLLSFLDHLNKCFKLKSIIFAYLFDNSLSNYIVSVCDCDSFFPFSYS